MIDLIIKGVAVLVLLLTAVDIWVSALRIGTVEISTKEDFYLDCAGGVLVLIVVGRCLGWW